MFAKCVDPETREDLLTSIKKGKRKMPRLKTFTWLYLLAAFVSFLVSVSLWFFAEDSKLEAIFVGIWVPSILSLGNSLEGNLGE